MRLAIAELQQESGTFLPSRTTLELFREGALAFGGEVATRYGDVLELGGAFAAGRARGDVEWVPLMKAAATPWGPLVHADFEWLMAQLLARLDAAGPVDGMLLVVHGALVTDGEPDPEGVLAERVKARLGDRPLVVTLDLHANVTERLVRSVDGLVAYKTSPHMDHFDTGRRGAELLFAAASGAVRPVVAHRKLPMITPAETHNSLRGPFAELLAEAARVEAQPGVLAVCLCPVQPWLDIPELGWSVAVTTDGDRALAQRLADELAALAWGRRHEFLVRKTPMAEAVRRAAAADGGTCVVSDSGDNTFGGAAGDSTELLKALFEHAPDLPAIVFVTDPPAVAAAIEAGVGQTVTVEVGGRFDREHYTPVRVTGRVRTIFDGCLELTGLALSGRLLNAGRSVVLAVGPIALIVTERALGNIDPCVPRAFGLEPTSYRLVQVKSPVGFRAGYEPIAREVILLESPGYTTSEFERLTWRVAPRPLFPLDDVPDDVALAFRREQ